MLEYPSGAEVPQIFELDSLTDQGKLYFSPLVLYYYFGSWTMADLTCKVSHGFRLHLSSLWRMKSPSCSSLGHAASLSSIRLSKAPLMQVKDSCVALLGNICRR